MAIARAREAAVSFKGHNLHFCFLLSIFYYYFFLWLFQIRFTRWVAIRVTDRHLLFINKGKCTRSAYARALVPC